MIRRLPDDSEFRMPERERLATIAGLNNKPAKLPITLLVLTAFVIGFALVSVASIF